MNAPLLLRLLFGLLLWSCTSFLMGCGSSEVQKSPGRADAEAKADGDVPQLSPEEKKKQADEKIAKIKLELEESTKKKSLKIMKAVEEIKKKEEEKRRAQEAASAKTVDTASAPEKKNSDGESTDSSAKSVPTQSEEKKDEAK